MKKDLLTLMELSRGELMEIIENSFRIKKNPGKYSDAMKNKSLALLFQKRSTRTRCSFEAGMARMGGHTIYMDWNSVQIDRAKIGDEMKCFSRYVDLIAARVNEHEVIKEMAATSEIPVINALCDKFHPCQAIADLTTIKEKKGGFGIKLAYIGDGNNVCNSLMIGCSLMGIKTAVAAPKGYEPLQEVLKFAKDAELTNNPEEAVKDADVVYTDTWVSMGNEREEAKRLKAFRPYQVNAQMMKLAKKDAIFMHCLPAHRNFEVTDEVIDSKQSAVFDQAENRMHTEKALILKMLGRM